MEFDVCCIPATLHEAVALLQSGACNIIAGGTDFVLQHRDICRTNGILLDITGIGECRGIRLEGERLRIGACCTFAEIADDPLVKQYAPALSAAASKVGSPQIRNAATVGGNVVNAMPAADGAVALFALSAAAEIANRNGVREIPVAACYRGIGKTALAVGQEILTAFYIPVGKNRFSAYRRFALRQSLALPVAACGVCVDIFGDTVVSCRIVLAPAGIAPWRAETAEKYLTGKRLNRDVIACAADIAAESTPFRDSPVRCTARYKREIAQTILEEALHEICAQSGSRRKA